MHRHFGKPLDQARVTDADLCNVTRDRGTGAVRPSIRARRQRQLVL